jgi:hypothetical protein
MRDSTHSPGRVRARGLAAALLAGMAAVALYGCGKQQPAEEPADKDKAKAERAAALEKQLEQSRNNLKLILQAVHNFNDTYKQLPPAAICDKKTGKPLLSWRVAILPFIEQKNLYEQFKLDEPWDSPNNKKLAEMVVPIYALPGAKDSEASRTHYRVFVGPPHTPNTPAWVTVPNPNMPFGAQGIGPLIRIHDGTANTLGLVEAAEAVPWTKPDELVYDAKTPLPKLGALSSDGFNAAMMDGVVVFITHRIDEPSLRALITSSGAEIVDTDGLRQKGVIK